MFFVYTKYNLDLYLKYIEEMKVLFFDTETTGLMPRDAGIMESEKMPYIVQFSYMIYDFETNMIDVISDEVVRLPDGVVIPPESIEFHGITDEISRTTGKDIKEILETFVVNAEKVNVIVSHNMDFDMRITLVELARIIKSLAPSSEKNKYYEGFNSLNRVNTHKYYCTVRESVDVCKIKAISKFGKEYNKFPTLSELHNHYFGFVPTGLHNSMNDVMIGMRCFGKLYFEKMGQPGVDVCEKNAEMQQMMDRLTPEEYKTVVSAVVEKCGKNKKKRKPRKKSSKKKNKSY